jgi:hypothetical protein
MDRSLRSLIALWPVLLGAVIAGYLIDELNDRASNTGLAQAVVEFLVR